MQNFNLSLEQRVARLEKEVEMAKLWKEAPNRKCLTAEEVAKWLGVAVYTVKSYERKGLLIPMYPNAKRRYDYQEVERFLRGLAPTRQAKIRAKMREKASQV